MIQYAAYLFPGYGGIRIRSKDYTAKRFPARLPTEIWVYGKSAFPVAVFKVKPKNK